MRTLNPPTARRRGFTLIEVTLATVILIVGLLFSSLFFTNVYDQLSPKGEYGGLRRYLLAEQMLKAQAEGMRATERINPVYIKLVTEPAGSNYDLNVDLMESEVNATAQYIIWDLEMNHKGQNIATLTMSTLRRRDGNDAKIGF